MCAIPSYPMGRAQDSSITEALKQFIRMHKTKVWVNFFTFLSILLLFQSLHFSTFMVITLHWYSEKFQIIQADNANWRAALQNQNRLVPDNIFAKGEMDEIKLSSKIRAIAKDYSDSREKSVRNTILIKKMFQPYHHQ